MTNQKSDVFTKNENVSDISEKVNMKPIELFSGTRIGTTVHLEPTASLQPIFGKDVKSTFKIIMK
jgi:hypothetical protein